jgi:membrane-associated phospholipid phosphatase
MRLASGQWMRTRFLLATSTAALLAFALLARSVARRGTREQDHDLRNTLLARQGPDGRAIAQSLGPLGKEWFHAPVALGITAWLWRRGRGRRSVVPLVASASAELVNRVCERWLHIRRPPPGQSKRHKPSFPSGHALETTAVALASSYVLVRERLVPPMGSAIAAVCLAAASGGGRLYLDRHWGSDAAGGYLLGIGIASTCGAAYESLRRRGTGQESSGSILRPAGRCDSQPQRP